MKVWNVLKIWLSWEYYDFFDVLLVLKRARANVLAVSFEPKRNCSKTHSKMFLKDFRDQNMSTKTLVLLFIIKYEDMEDVI